MVCTNVGTRIRGSQGLTTRRPPIFEGPFIAAQVPTFQGSESKFERPGQKYLTGRRWVLDHFFLAVI